MWSPLVLWLAVAGLGAAVLCPDGQVCDTKSTCCQLPEGGIGCCPLPQEVQASLPMVMAGSENEVSENLCPNAASCPPEYTCLQTPVGAYSCCPLPEAVSCGDGRHCCPLGFRCSNDGRSCLKHSGNLALDVVCPDGAVCLDGNTCCQMLSGQYGCCPLPNAVCCSDHASCCPKGTTCDVIQGTCNGESGVFPLLSKTPALEKPIEAPVLQRLTMILPVEEKGNLALDVVCPDGHACPDGNTCCQLLSGQYGCCPHPSAVCCSDHASCCPQGTTCDLSQGKCIGESGVFPLLSKTPALEKPIKAPALQRLTKILPVEEKGDTSTTIICPDGGFCNDGTTCCLLSTGRYGCCPYQSGICCPDKVHCCPAGMRCLLDSCSSGKALPWDYDFSGRLKKKILF